MADAVGINRARIGVPDFDLRYKISRIFADLVRFAVDSTVAGSRILIPSKKHAHKTLQDGLMVPLSPPLKDKNKPNLKVANDVQCQNKVEAVEEHTNILKQQYQKSTESVDGSQPPKKPSDDGLKGTDLPKKNGRRVFIRSRL